MINVGPGLAPKVATAQLVSAFLLRMHNGWRFSGWNFKHSSCTLSINKGSPSFLFQWQEDILLQEKRNLFKSLWWDNLLLFFSIAFLRARESLCSRPKLTKTRLSRDILSRWGISYNGACFPCFHLVFLYAVKPQRTQKRCLSHPLAWLGLLQLFFLLCDKDVGRQKKKLFSSLLWP